MGMRRRFGGGTDDRLEMKNVIVLVLEPARRSSVSWLEPHNVHLEYKPYTTGYGQLERHSHHAMIMVIRGRKSTGSCHHDVSSVRYSDDSRTSIRSFTCWL